TLPLFKQMGISDEFMQMAGPPVRRVGLLAGGTVAAAPLPKPEGCEVCGRALGREPLDTILLRRAQAAGVDVRQPIRAASFSREGNIDICEAISMTRSQRVAIRCKVVIAAHGSWDAGSLPTQQVDRRPRAADLLGFKAHFTGSNLPEDLMPL